MNPVFFGRDHPSLASSNNAQNICADFDTKTNCKQRFEEDLVRIILITKEKIADKVKV